MTFPIGKTEVRLTFGAAAIVAFCIVAGEGEALLLAVLSLTVHECAHIVAAKNRRIAIARISIWPFGAVMTLGDTFGREGEWITAAAGPIGSASFAAMLSLFTVLFGARTWTQALIRTNLLIAAINLLPAFPLDGGRIFFALLSRAAHPGMARTILMAFTAIIAAGALGVGLWLVLHGVPAWTLLALPPFLVASAIAECRQPDAGTVSRVMERSEALRCGVPQKAQLVVVTDGTSVGDALTALSNHRLTVLLVRRGTGSFLLDESALLDAAAKSGMSIPLKTVISRLTAPK